MNCVKTISDNFHISSFFRSITRQNDLPVSIRQNEMQYSGQLNVDRKSRTIHLKISKAKLKLDEATVYMTINEVMFSFRTKIEYNGQTFTLSSPSELQISIDRTVPRLKIAPESGAQFIIGTDIQGPIADISTKGLAFYSTRPIPPASFPNCLILLADHKIYVDTEVKYSRRVNHKLYRIGVEFKNSDLNWQDFIKLFQYTTKFFHPTVQPIYHFKKKLIFNLYKESGYFGLKPGHEIQDRFFDMMKCLSTIGNKPSLGESYALADDQKLVAAGSVLRIYNNTFIGHQLASLPRIRYIMELYLSIIDFILNNKYAQYYIAYFNMNETWHQKMYYEIGQLINDPNLFTYDTFHCYDLLITEGLPSSPSQNQIQELPTPESEFLSLLSPIEIKAYDYEPEKFNLDCISQIYETIDLHLKRKYWKVTENGETVAHVVAEVFSNGLNLYNVMDMCRVHFTKYDNIQNIIKTIIPVVQQFYRRYFKQKILFLFKTPDHFDNLNLSDLIYQQEMGRIMVSQAGVSEYRKFIHLNYNLKTTNPDTGRTE